MTDSLLIYNKAIEAIPFSIFLVNRTCKLYIQNRQQKQALELILKTILSLLNVSHADFFEKRGKKLCAKNYAKKIMRKKSCEKKNQKKNT